MLLRGGYAVSNHASLEVVEPRCLSLCSFSKGQQWDEMKPLSKLNLPEFIELIKAGQKLEAVKHARKHLASDDPEHFHTIQKGMALLAFSGSTTIQPYRDLLSDDRLRLFLISVLKFVVESEKSLRYRCCVL